MQYFTHKVSEFNTLQPQNPQTTTNQQHTPPQQNEYFAYNSNVLNTLEKQGGGGTP
jgi:hypothetical protein